MAAKYVYAVFICSIYLLRDSNLLNVYYLLSIGRYNKASRMTDGLFESGELDDIDLALALWLEADQAGGEGTDCASRAGSGGAAVVGDVTA